MYSDWKTSLEPLLSTLGEKYKNKKPQKNNTQSKQRKSSNKILEKTPDLTVKQDEDGGSSQCSKSISLRSSSGTWSVKNMEQDTVLNVTNFTHQENPKKLKTEKHNEGGSVKERPLPVVDRKKTVIAKDKSRTDSIDMSDSAVDPFFVTKDNKEYLSVSMKETQQNRLENDVEEITRDRSDNVAKRFKAKRKEFPVPDRQKKDDFKCSNTRKESFTLHPSWAAKKNPLNSGILQPEKFVGKKIKFDVYDD